MLNSNTTWIDKLLELKGNNYVIKPIDELLKINVMFLYKDRL